MKRTGWPKKLVVQGLLMMFIGIASRVYGDGGDPTPSFLQQKIDSLEQKLSDLQNKPVVEATLADASGGSSAAASAKKIDPFSEFDYTWVCGNGRTTSAVLDTKYFTPEVLMDVGYAHDFANPIDHTIVGSGITNRSDEFQVEHFGVGGDFHIPTGPDGNNAIRARIMTQLGLYSQAIPRNDDTPGVGAWNLQNAYRYVTEMYAGYHFDKMYGVNLDAGIFPSYIGLWSFYEAENWTDTPSYVSSNTPWFFNGVRIQTFPTPRFKEEYWIINGWQTYGDANNLPAIGSETKWMPNGNWDLVSNNYVGHDGICNPANTVCESGDLNKGRLRIHSDDSILMKYWDHPESFIDKMAWSFTGDIGCENGGGVQCGNGDAQTPSQYFIGAMVYNRMWFDHDHYALTVGGGAIDNPGRYLVLLPPINGATAITGSPYFTENPGDEFHAWDYSVTFDYMPDQWILYRLEYGHRHSSEPYWEGSNGITPPGGETGNPSQTNITNADGSTWTPDLVENQNRLTLNMVIKI